MHSLNATFQNFTCFHKHRKMILIEFLFYKRDLSLTIINMYHHRNINIPLYLQIVFSFLFFKKYSAAKRPLKMRI